MSLFYWVRPLEAINPLNYFVFFSKETRGWAVAQERGIYAASPAEFAIG